ncbi:oligosaccharide flippase family protein [Lysinibacillus fusiformis]|uniref:oligosaccharide flippase family protein n=1 Tax=Lysinibacillus fusiformis TaxID=28031 RepID=UPI002E20F0DB|nr:oligosaccharide flippase family protein [Lysinibacillus fusiformis]MED4887905.1 oligosaccharide flippase family protein [Lysinibacillus fusiformis]
MKEIKIGAILSYLTIGCTMISSLLFTPFMISLLGQKEFGLYSLMIVLVGYLSILDLGLGNAIVRYIARNRAIADKALEASLNGFFLKLFMGIGCLTLLIGFFLFSQVHIIFGQSLSGDQLAKAKVMGYIMTISVAVQFPLGVFTSILQAYEKFIFIKLTTLLQVIVQPLTMLFFLLQGTDAVTLIYIIAIYNILFLVLDVIYCIRVLSIRFTFTLKNIKLIKEIFIYSFFIFITVIVDKIYWQTDQVLLGILKGTEDVAIYAVAMQIVLIFMSLALAISGLFLPRISMLVTKEDGLLEINQLFIKVGAIQFLVVGYILGGFFLFGKEFLLLWLGKDFMAIYAIVLIIMVPFSIDLIQNLGINVLKAKNLFKFRTILLMIVAVVNIIVSIPAIYFYGKMGTAIITACSLLIGNVVIMNIYYYKKIGLDILGFWRTISRLVLAFILAICCSQLLWDLSKPPITWISIILYIFYYTVLAGGSLFFIGMTKEQRRKWIELLRKGGAKFWS